MSSTVSSTGSAATPTTNSVITSTGVGSGLDINAIVSELTTAFGAAQTAQLTNQQNSLNAQVSAFGTFSSALDTLQATLGTLQDPRQLAAFSATVGNTAVASATASTSAQAGQYSLAVQNLATVANLTSAPVVGSATSVGTGTLTIAVGGQAASITIDSSNNTLAGIAAAINGAPDNPGVSASIITAIDGSRLVLSGTNTGAANSVTVTQSGGDGGLSALVYDPASGIKHLTQTQAAVDANFSINNYAATSASNVVTGALSGVTLNLLQATTAGSPTTLTISPDTAAAQTSIGTFVTALNGLLTSVQTLTGYNATTQTAGTLQGNATLQSFQNQLQNILDTVTSSTSGGVTSLAALGLTADANTGTLDTNSTTLSNALSANLSSVGKLLGGANGIATQINNLIKEYTGPGGLLTTVNQSLTTGLKNVTKQQTALATQLATYSATLTSQYNAMDAAVAALKQTQTYLNAEFNPTSALSSSSSSSSLSSGRLST